MIFTLNDFLLVTWMAAAGATVGSFLNVVIYRLPRGESLVSPPSHCPKCNHAIRWYDNLPIFGWFLLGGKCRDCKLPISFRYPMIETIACTIVTTFAILIMPLNFAIEHLFVQIFRFSVLQLFLLTLGMIDYDRQTLKPVGLSLFLTPILIFGIFFKFQNSIWEPFVGVIVSAALGFSVAKFIRVNDHNLWLFATIAVGGFLGWQMAILILFVTLPCHAAIVFVTQRSYSLLAYATTSFGVCVWWCMQRIPEIPLP